MHISPRGTLQGVLFDEVRRRESDVKMMAALDALNQRESAIWVRFGDAGVGLPGASQGHAVRKQNTLLYDAME